MNVRSKLVLVLIFIALAIATLGMFGIFREDTKFDGKKPTSLNSVSSDDVGDLVTSRLLALSPTELQRLQNAARAGDCGAALEVARHYSFGTNQLEESINWLRLAARCDDVAVKGSLIKMLRATGSSSANSAEIAQLLAEIHKIDPKVREYDEALPR